MFPLHLFLKISKTTDLKSVECAVVFKCEHVVGDGEEVAVSRHQCAQMKSLHYRNNNSVIRGPGMTTQLFMARLLLFW